MLDKVRKLRLNLYLIYLYSRHITLKLNSFLLNYHFTLKKFLCYLLKYWKLIAHLIFLSVRHCLLVGGEHSRQIICCSSSSSFWTFITRLLSILDTNIFILEYWTRIFIMVKLTLGCRKCKQHCHNANIYGFLAKAVWNSRLSRRVIY
jgi:hypothetical protein